MSHGATRKCSRCIVGIEECIIHPNFWLCEWCDGTTQFKLLELELDVSDIDDWAENIPTQPGWTAWTDDGDDQC
jgi:hypothetical protein